MRKGKSYFLTIEIKCTGKTKTFMVFSRVNNAHLGYVRWYSPWRRYCFFPADSTIFDGACLDQMCQFIVAQNLDHKAGIR